MNWKIHNDQTKIYTSERLTKPHWSTIPSVIGSTIEQYTYKNIFLF